MAVKAYEPREGVTGLVVEVQLGGGETFVVGDEDHPWPYATGNPAEQDYLDASEQVKQSKVDEAESHDPKAEAKVQEKEHNATQAAAELAVKEGVDLSVVDGSGEGGKILLADVQATIAEWDQEPTSETDNQGGER